MKISLLSGSIVGSKTSTALRTLLPALQQQFAGDTVQLIDLKDYNIQFSDGRNYLEYEGDTLHVVSELMDSDVIVIGTPVFQASLPATLKNIFDLLPQNALLGKVSAIVVTAGSAKHYLVAEQQLKPILSYMKAQIVQTYVFIEEQDFDGKKIINDDVLLRLDRLAADLKIQTDTFKASILRQEASYGF